MGDGAGRGGGMSRKDGRNGGTGISGRREMYGRDCGSEGEHRKAERLEN